MLEANEIRGGYGTEDVIRGISFSAAAGEVVGILGPNGCGKSTLIKLISGLLPPRSGTVRIGGRDASGFSKKEFARKVAVLPQLHHNAFSQSVRETVSLGRYPHQSGLFPGWKETDEQAVGRAMDAAGIGGFGEKRIDLLSGGERQRVFVAQALAQEAPILLLDEPTNHLDIAHQQQLLDSVRNLAKDQGTAVVSIFHDINLAALYCDRLIILSQGRIAAEGPPGEVIREEIISEVYGARINARLHPEIPKPQILLLPAGQEKTASGVRAADFTVTADEVRFEADRPLRTVSSAVLNAGAGWARLFINRRVDPEYSTVDVREEMTQYVTKTGGRPAETVAMMTAVPVGRAVIRDYGEGEIRLTVMVTASTGHALDASRQQPSQRMEGPGTINTWVMINGRLPDEAFVQALVTATEAKTAVLNRMGIRDPRTGTPATGTATDSLLIAATQTGPELPYAGPLTELGALIGRAVGECTQEAIRREHAHTGKSTGNSPEYQ
ncbi:adenosylcobinamide amidohydrolase [Bhargavaea ginsengi]|uniref:adenosylcobinamide amidohydrolase n=1 Tax=Bhargavaea ginsengi TaxID=426757 RepID=UPI00203EF818|nr:adenosylcobinamide amidohydrolase [Bhargavaea ginsengi]MCM3087158.1 adenosylcobinamide amidohydrolase [Bhargavaea ginsengi]